MLTCQSCGHPLHTDTITEITPNWNYRTQCEYCGQEQFGAIYFGAFYPAPQEISTAEPA